MPPAPDPAPDRFESIARERAAELVDDLDEAAFAASFNLFRVSARLLADLEAHVHRPQGLSMAGFRILFTVWVHDELEPRSIAQLSGVSRAAVSGVLNTLERDGLVTRRRDRDDGRLVTVRVTDAGAELLAITYRSQNERERRHYADLSPERLAAFTDSMRTLLTTRLDRGDSE